VQYAIKAVRFGQVLVGLFFFFGEQILSMLGQQPFGFMEEIPSNLMAHGAALYGLNCIASTLKSINAFEVIYNGEVVHSKLSTGKFPDAGELSKRLKDIKQKSWETLSSTISIFCAVLLFTFALAMALIL